MKMSLYHSPTRWRNEILNLFNDFGGVPDSGRGEGQDWFPSEREPLVQEEKDHFRLSVDVPGFCPEDIKVKREGDTLSLSAAAAGEKKKTSSSRLWGGRSFDMSFSLPSSVKTEGIQAHCEHGVLTVLLPKKREAEAVQIPVQAKPAKRPSS